jgi:hypothetical protein
MSGQGSGGPTSTRARSSSRSRSAPPPPARGTRAPRDLAWDGRTDARCVSGHLNLGQSPRGHLNLGQSPRRRARRGGHLNLGQSPRRRARRGGHLNLGQSPRRRARRGARFKRAVSAWLQGSFRRAPRRRSSHQRRDLTVVGRDRPTDRPRGRPDCGWGRDRGWARPTDRLSTDRLSLATDHCRWRAGATCPGFVVGWTPVGSQGEWTTGAPTEASSSSLELHLLTAMTEVISTRLYRPTMGHGNGLLVAPRRRPARAQHGPTWTLTPIDPRVLTQEDPLREQRWDYSRERRRSGCMRRSVRRSSSECASSALWTSAQRAPPSRRPPWIRCL